jgi:hypothetical protein
MENWINFCLSSHIIQIITFFFTFVWPYIVTNFFIIKPKDTLISKFILAKNEPPRVSSSSSAHHQESINCTLGTGICHTGLKKTFEQGRDIPTRPCSEAVWRIPVPSVQLMDSWWWAEELPETCRGSFLAKINLGNWCICWFYCKETNNHLFYCCTVHLDNIKIVFTNECTFYWTYKMLKFTIKTSIHSSLHVSVHLDHLQGAYGDPC